MQNLDHEQFEGAKVLADIGTKIAAGRAALSALEKGKEDFLEDRAAEATQRVQEVLEQSKDIIAEIGKYHSELVGYSNQVDGFLTDVLYLIQSVERWKEAFDEQNAAKLAEINTQIAENKVILEQIEQARALLAGEDQGIRIKRRNLNSKQAQVDDEWATLGRTKEELNIKP